MSIRKRKAECKKELDEINLHIINIGQRLSKAIDENDDDARSILSYEKEEYEIKRDKIRDQCNK